MRNLEIWVDAYLPRTIEFRTNRERRKQIKLDRMFQPPENICILRSRTRFIQASVYPSSLRRYSVGVRLIWATHRCLAHANAVSQFIEGLP